MHQAFNFISEESGDRLYILKSLNSLETVDLNIYVSMADHFSEQDIIDLLEDKNWRSHLIAYTYILANKAESYLTTLMERLSNGSFVSPQIAVSIAILGKQNVGEYFLNLLAKNDVGWKSFGAILAVLPVCSVSHAPIKEAVVDVDEFAIGFKVASEHLNFWQLRL